MFFSLNKIHTIILNKYAVYLKKNRKVKFYDIVFCAGLEGLRVIGHGYEIEKVNSQIQYINTIDYMSRTSVDRNFYEDETKKIRFNASPRIG